MAENICILLKKRSEGVPLADDFEIVKRPIDTPGDGELLCETHFLSLDPYLRGRISGRHLSGAILPGELMGGEAVCRVLESRHPGFARGDWLAAHSGWQQYPVIDADSARKVDPDLGPVSTTLGILGMPGLTAYAGLLRLGQPKAGDTVLVSAATGPVGSMVAQIAQIKGATAIGIAGSPDKCAWAVEQARMGGCINYKEEILADGIRRLCPEGVDVYFDNVGGDCLQASMENLALGARVVLCGLMAQYNRDDMPPGPNPAWIIKARAIVRGMVVYDHEDLRPQFLSDVSKWLKEDRIRYLEDFAEGLENAPEAFHRLMTGRNFGKALVKVAS